MKKCRMICLFLPGLLWAAQTGSIEGTVTDADSGQPLAGVTVMVENTLFSSMTELTGSYQIQSVPAGKYTLVTTSMGYKTVKMPGITVESGKKTTVHVKMKPTAMEGETVSVMAERSRLKKDLAGSVRNIQSVSDMDVFSYSARPAFMPSPEMTQNWNTEEYDKIDESGFIEALRHPLSTFAADVDAASYANVRRFLMRDEMPYKDAVRSEELINYFNYDYPEPAGEHPLSVTLECGECPWNPANRLVHIGLQGKKLKRDETKPSNLVFLLDVSGSMNDPKKLPLLQKAFNLLVDQLNAKDRVAIVAYAGAAGLILPSTPGSEKQAIKEAINHLSAGGSTAGGQGIQLAYETARKNRIQGGNNRVILATDGDFNIGISSTSELTRFIEEKRDEGIFLTVLGFGMGNYKDHRLQELADRGNGNHAYIDNIMEAKKVLVNEILATLYTIAKDVKIQVEFNPAHVRSYRLIGYENRALQDKDFTDDTKDAGEIGSGHSVTALYEIVPAGPDDEKQVDMKYQTTQIRKSAEDSGELLTVRLRYKPPEGDTSVEFSEALQGSPADAVPLSDNFRFSAAVAEFAMILRNSEFKGTSSIGQVKTLARSGMGKDIFGYRAEFLTLVDRTELLMKKPAGQTAE